MSNGKTVGTGTKIGEGVAGFGAGGAVALLLPRLYPDMAAQDVALLASFATLVLAWGRSVLRRAATEYGWRWLKVLTGVGLVVVLVGCAGFEPGKRTKLDEEGPPMIVREYFDEAGRMTHRDLVRFKASLLGRGCHAFDVNAGTESIVISYVGQQDGSSDWSSVRGLVAVLPETLAVIIGPVTTLMEALTALAGRPPMTPPSEIHGCEGVEAFYESGTPA